MVGRQTEWGKRDYADGPGNGVLSLDRDPGRLSDFGPELQLLANKLPSWAWARHGL